MILIRFLWALVGSKAARTAAIALAVLVGARVWLWTHDNKVSDRALQKLDTQTRELTDQAVKAREAANKPGSAERLKRKFCGDC